jgi:hypothetical protein
MEGPLWMSSDNRLNDRIGRNPAGQHHDLNVGNPPMPAVASHLG